MVEKATPGAYVSVGSERSFRGVSMAPQVTHVYLLDISPEIIRFNHINIQLLKAPTRKDYLSLRWEADYKAWKKISSSLTQEDFKWWCKNVRDIEAMGYSLPEELNRYQSYSFPEKFRSVRNKLIHFYKSWRQKEVPTLPEKMFVESITLDQLTDLGKKLSIPLPLSQKEWDWWTAYGKNKKNDCAKTLLKNPEQAIDFGQVVDFKTGNYLFEDTLYQRLHSLAIQKRFTLMKVNLGEQKGLEQFITQLKKNKDTISVLDLDNLYFEEYIGEKKYKEIVEKLAPYGQNNSLLVVMSNYKDYGCGQFQMYLGFTFGNIRSWPPFFYMQTFIDTLPPEILDLIDGRVYDKEDKPPYQYMLGM